MEDFMGFPKIGRLSRLCVITEKIDGTNAQIYNAPDGTMYVGSRKRWITPEDDNYGFARWARDNEEELRTLGEGQHFGEWWGQGIQRKYGMKEKVFSLFQAPVVLPSCCRVVPTLYIGEFRSCAVDRAINTLMEEGSKAAPGFMNPEGVVVWHSATRSLFKKTIKDDHQPKGKTQ